MDFRLRETDTNRWCTKPVCSAREGVFNMMTTALKLNADRVTDFIGE